MMRWEEIVREVKALNAHVDDLHAEWSDIKKRCAHPRLPKRGIEEFHDVCPDCGFVSYMHAL